MYVKKIKMTKQNTAHRKYRFVSIPIRIKKRVLHAIHRPSLTKYIHYPPHLGFLA